MVNRKPPCPPVKKILMESLLTKSSYIVLSSLCFLNVAPQICTSVVAQETVLQLKLSDPSTFGTDVRSHGKPQIEVFSTRHSRRALFLDGASYLKIPGNDQSTQFRNGDSITISAWVAPSSLRDDQQIYIVGKGRTGRTTFDKENQNYALRLRGINGTARVSFLFRSASVVNGAAGSKAGGVYHRWNSSSGFPVDGSWHHVAIHYRFGDPTKIVALVDGQTTSGDWDMGGPTTLEPVVDNDEIWIGSSMGGNRDSSYRGWISDLEILRNSNSLSKLVKTASQQPPSISTDIQFDRSLETGKLLIDVFENVTERVPPFRVNGPSQERYFFNHFGLDGIPEKYVRPGVISDRSPVYMVRGQILVNLEGGEYEVFFRAKNATALLVDNKVVGELSMMTRNASGHEEVPILAPIKDPQAYPIRVGHRECSLTLTLKKGKHLFRLETLVGGKGLRNELGECIVGIKRPQQRFFELLSNGSAPKLSQTQWKNHVQSYQHQLSEINQAKRRELSALDKPYWTTRRQLARTTVEARRRKMGVQSIDGLLAERLEAEGKTPTHIAADVVFLRRVYFDTVGVPPSAEKIRQFINDPSPVKRITEIDYLLRQPGYADHWVSYWQDVLAENPGLLKPKLNNTGPFRFWIYESLLDNKPMDRFVSELISMGGSQFNGGPAGFGQASQNDVPEAAKANVIARAFLGIDLTCARCHDSPSNSIRQQDVFELAAMLRKKPIQLPVTSSVANSENFSDIKVTLEPGQMIQPNWPFNRDMNSKSRQGKDGAERLMGDTRRKLSELIIDSENRRFSMVMVNRIWSRLMGKGLADSSDEFVIQDSDNIPLIEYLADYFTSNGYDAKKLIRLIMKSNAYQRQSSEDDELVEDWGARKIRNLTAEQIVDSLFSISGKPMSIGELTFDPEGRRTASTFLNLGNPSRSWELIGLANERDRPALALPRAQSVVDVLSAFGWRESRPNPITEREETATLIQPLVLANGDAAHRATQLSADSFFTRLAIQSRSVEKLTQDSYLQVLGRLPSSAELAIVTAELENGFEGRLIAGPTQTGDYASQFRTAVSWSNHLHPEATRIKMEIERAVRQGDRPTARLQPRWRERMEDVVWALFNTPEFRTVQ